MFKRSLLLAAIGACNLLPGCMLVRPIQEMTRETLRTMRPRTTDYRDPSDDPGDEWSSVGVEARGDMPMDKGGDPLYSPKARSIERNLGVGL